ncbi:alpha-glucosidase [Sarracenia purpurea var. burkii]
MELSFDQPSLEFYPLLNCSTKPSEHCLDFADYRVLVSRTSNRCFNVNFTSSIKQSVTARVHLGHLHVYGGAEHAEMRWPIEKTHYPEHAYVTTTYYYQAVLEPFWLTSNGYYIYVDDSVPLLWQWRQVEIDDNWELCYGGLEPHPGKFPDLRLVVNEIKKLNFRVTIWIHPFVNEECEGVHDMGLESGFFVRNYDNETLTKWWRGHAGQIDFTNPKAAKWFKRRLEKLKQLYNIDSFKFDGGESDVLAETFYVPYDGQRSPSYYRKSYVKTISSLGKNVHTRVARGTQKYPIFVTMMDRESVWSIC